MKRSRPKRGLVTLLLALLLVTTVVPAQAASARNMRAIDMTKQCSLTVKFNGGSGAPFRLYKVAALDKDAQLTVEDRFKTYEEEILDIAKEDKGVKHLTWKQMADKIQDGVTTSEDLAAKPDQVKSTDGGQVKFEGLQPGIYLAVGGDGKNGNRTWGNYTFQPVLVSLPGLPLDKDGNTDTTKDWAYDVEADAKFSRKPGGGGGSKTTSLEVLKIWAGDGKEEHPASVTVSLYNGTKLHDTVTLSKDNNWTHKWTGLSRSGNWVVSEPEVPEGYTVTVEQQGTRFVVTNTKDTDIPDEPPPEGPPDLPPDNPTPENPPDNPPDTPDTPDSPPDTPDKPSTPDKPTKTTPKLPQTGQLWWPVPVLVCGGLGCFIVSVVLKGKEDDA